MKIFFLSCLCLLLVAVPPVLADEEEESKSNFTITIAFGGALGGLFWFISYSSGFAPDWSRLTTETALFNHSPDGWRVGLPLVKLVNDGSRSYAPYIDILSLKF